MSENIWAGKLWESQVRRSKLDEFKQTFIALKKNFEQSNNLQMYFDVYHIRENLDVLIELGQQTMSELLKSPLTFGSLIG
jgi:hypothetical protein